ncbi:MAG: CidA/LrgA family protein [Rhodospirillales bacterium]|nr:CidA/LrgA family protein [Rhodospirillales bacterium]
MRPITTVLRYRLHHSRILQIALLCAFWLAGEGLVRVAHLPVPGGIAGMLIVLALLASRRLSPVSMRRGADWFLAEMLLFFVPAVLAVLDHHEFLGWTGLKILAVILGGTVTVMSVTALTVDLCVRLSLRHAPAA